MHESLTRHINQENFIAFNLLPSMSLEFLIIKLSPFIHDRSFRIFFLDKLLAFFPISLRYPSFNELLDLVNKPSKSLSLQRKPVFPSSRVYFTPPVSKATTGKPQAWASAVTSPWLSCIPALFVTEVIRNISASCNNLQTSFGLTFPLKKTTPVSSNSSTRFFRFSLINPGPGNYIFYFQAFFY